MKFKLLPQNQYLIKLLCVIVLFTLTLVIIHSCKKDLNNNKSQTALDSIAMAKTWYEQSYTAASTTAVNRSLSQSNAGTSGKLFDYTKFISPNWKLAATYKRYNANVVELPIDPSSWPVATALSNSTSTTPVYKPQFSRSSFLILNDSAGYHAYIMTLIADSTYLNGDLIKLDKNKYNKRDPAFSGVVMYNSPDGTYVNGWVYRNGSIAMQLPPGNNNQSSKPLIITNANAAISAPKTVKFKETDRLVAITTCATWTQTVTVDGVNYGTTDLGTKCITTFSGSLGDGGGGGTSGAGSSGSGGSGSSSGSSPSPTPPPPCAVAPSGGGVESVLPGGITRAVQTPPPPVGGVGFPPPTAPADPCAETTTTTTTTVPDTIGSLIKKPTPLTQAQKDGLQAILNQILQNCIGQALVGNLVSNGHQFIFSINSSLAVPAAYNPSNNTIQISNLSTLQAGNLEEELFHAYQNFNYAGGTSKYAGAAGSANIEFEAKLLNDMNTSIYGGTWLGPVATSGYQTWVYSLTNYSAFPTSFTSTQRDYYFIYMADFIQQNSGYSSDVINYSLDPTAMFNLISSSACKNQ